MIQERTLSLKTLKKSIHWGRKKDPFTEYPKEDPVTDKPKEDSILSLRNLKRTLPLTNLRSFRALNNFRVAKSFFFDFLVIVYDKEGVGTNFHMKILVLEALLVSYGSLYFATFFIKSISHTTASFGTWDKLIEPIFESCCKDTLFLKYSYS